MSETSPGGEQYDPEREKRLEALLALWGELDAKPNPEDAAAETGLLDPKSEVYEGSERDITAALRAERAKREKAD